MSEFRFVRLLLYGVAVLAPTFAFAQPPGPPDDDLAPARGRPGQRGGPPGENRPVPPGLAIMRALDADRNGELSADEIRNASKALKSLDRNHDGVLDRSELGPPVDGPGRPNEPPDGPRRGERFGGPPPGGPDGPPDGPRRGDRFGGPPPRGPDGPPDDRPPDGSPAGARPGRPEIGHVLPPFARDELRLTGRQMTQIGDLENEVKRKLESILTADQVRQLRDLLDRGPGGPGGARGRRGRGGPPRGGPPDNDDEPPVRPRRPPQ